MFHNFFICLPLLILAIFPARKNNVKPRHFSYVGRTARHNVGVAASLQKQLGQFLRKKRGEMSYPAFARKLGISSSSLHRMEMGDQNVTLKTLEHILKRFKCSANDIFDRQNS
jgi:DNA-binding Xre family transcriptional regulator